jgi:mannan endo-1,4-beta-mannosidase
VHQLVVDQPRYRLARIAAGAFDSYIRSYAEQVKQFGGPVMLRPFHEMDGNWYPWGGTVNGNSAVSFIAAWRHVHDIFDEVGATNVTWVWSVNSGSVPDTPENSGVRYWPGGRYVDWIGISGFNWGKSSSFGSWYTFDQVYKRRIGLLMQFRKPIVLTEIGAAEVGGDKAVWIRRTFSTIVQHYPRVRAFVWYDKRDSALQDWRITSSQSSLAAFRSTLRNPAFLSAPAAEPTATRRRFALSR